VKLKYCSTRVVSPASLHQGERRTSSCREGVGKVPPGLGLALTWGCQDPQPSPPVKSSHPWEGGALGDLQQLLTPSSFLSCVQQVPVSWSVRMTWRLGKCFAQQALNLLWSLTVSAAQRGLGKVKGNEAMSGLQRSMQQFWMLRTRAQHAALPCAAQTPALSFVHVVYTMPMYQVSG